MTAVISNTSSKGANQQNLREFYSDGVMGWSVLPQNSYEALTLSTSECEVLGAKSFKGVIKLQ